MSRLCLDSPVTSHLTQFTSLSSNEGSQGSLYLISTTSGLTSTTLSLTHSIPDTESSSILLRHAQHYCASGSLHLLFLLPRKILPWISSWLSCSFSWFLSLWEKDQHDYPVKISFLSLCHCSLSSLCSTFCFFSRVYHHWKHYMFICLCGCCYLLTTTSTRTQASQRHRLYFSFFFSLKHPNAWNNVWHIVGAQ